MTFTLAKLAYIACSEAEKFEYNNYDTPKIMVKSCCVDLLQYLKTETNMNNNVYNNEDLSDVEISAGAPVMYSFWSEKAAYNGHLECLKFAEERGFPWTASICHQAAANGQLELLKYAREQGCPWDELVCEFAAANGHLECLKFANEQGCPWDEMACSKAARYGQLECLVYLHEHGCPWDISTCEAAAVNGQLECFIFAIANGCPMPMEFVGPRSFATNVSNIFHTIITIQTSLHK